jgi:hypothetical protein
MYTRFRSWLLAGLLCVSGALPLFAQEQDVTPITATAYAQERTLIETALQTVIRVIQQVTVEQVGLGNQLRGMSSQLTEATGALSQPRGETLALTPQDLERLEALLVDLSDQLAGLSTELQQEGSPVADRLLPIAEGLDEAVTTVRRLRDDTPARTPATVAQGERWLRPGRYEDNRYEPKDEEDDRENDQDDWEDADETEDDEEDEDWWQDRDDDEDETWQGRRDRRNRDARGRHRNWRDRGCCNDWDWETYLGDFGYGWPFHETGLYRPIPAIRYNRVEGLTLSARRAPLSWESRDRGRVYGQIGYAFALEDLRYEVGVETRLGNRYGNNGFDLKLGGAYRQNTTTNDLWKLGWSENSLGAFFFENDFFDYYETEGWTVYSAARLSPYVQLTGGYRAEDHRSLVNETGWSFFGDGENDFRFNPGIEAGRMQSVVLSLDGGHIQDTGHRPRGAGVRLEAELGKGMGGDFSFNRYVADARVYTRLGRYNGLSLRLRGGYADGNGLPVQRGFTLGGIGSVRGYPQNAFLGTRMLVGNVEYALYEADLFDEVFDGFELYGLFDAAWVNDRSNRFDWDEVIPSAGAGLGLGDRAVRLELAFPLRDVSGFGKEPSLWLRLSPSF